MIKCGHCKERHTTVAKIRECFTTGSRVHVLIQLSEKKGGLTGDKATELAATLSPDDIEAVINFLTKQPDYVAVVDGPVIDENAAERELAEAEYAADAARAAQIEEGMYNHDGQIYRVQRSRESGNLYAKKLDSTTQKFAYAPGAMRSIVATDRMTIEAAKSYGREFGVCCVCARELSNPVSVEAGIGPVCGSRV